jgi:uncharacterized membrane protein
VSAGRERPATWPRRLWLGLRRYFVAGLAIVLPTFLTLYILWFLVSLVGAVLSPFVRGVLRLVFARETVPLLVTPVSLVVIAALIWLIGFTGAAFSRRLFERTARHLIDMFFRRDRSVKQAALIEAITAIVSGGIVSPPGRAIPAAPLGGPGGGTVPAPEGRA